MEPLPDDRTGAHGRAHDHDGNPAPGRAHVGAGPRPDLTKHPDARTSGHSSEGRHSHAYTNNPDDSRKPRRVPRPHGLPMPAVWQVMIGGQASHAEIRGHYEGLAADLRQEQPSWSMQASSDRDKAIAVILDARQRICDVRLALQHYDMSLANKLASFAAELDTRLGALLVAQMDAVR